MAGQQAEVLGVERRVEEGANVTYLKVDVGGGDIEEVQYFEEAGGDSPPIVGDFVAIEELGKSGSKHAVGCHDSKSTPKAEPGEKRIYSRTESGTLLAELWLRHGEVVLEVFDPSIPVRVKGGKVVLESPDVNFGQDGGRPVACSGDFVAGSVRAICGAPGSPIIPVPPATPTPTGGVPFVGQIISGVKSVKAREG